MPCRTILFLRRRSLAATTTPTAKATTELRSELARGTALLALASITPAIPALTVATVAPGSTTATRAALTTVVAEHATRRSV